MKKTNLCYGNYVKDFLTRLQNGESKEIIAADITAALDEAIHENEANTRKQKELDAIISQLRDYAKKYYPELELELDFTAEDLISVLDKFPYSLYF